MVTKSPGAQDYSTLEQESARWLSKDLHGTGPKATMNSSNAKRHMFVLERQFLLSGATA